MEQNRTSLFSNSLLWFGAAVSIAEILTGAFIAPLGLAKGIIAIVVGHLIGCCLLYGAGLIGAKSGLSAMESVRISFGKIGSYVFSVLNILQLVGWTAIMIIGGAKAIGVIVNPSLGLQGDLIWCVLIGAFILLWIAVGMKNLGKVNVVAVGLLFVLTIILSTLLFKERASIMPSGDPISFGMALELSVAMPLSWLPLISDYTRNSHKPKAVTLVSTASYFIGSCWMYIIGLGAALFSGTSDIAQLMLSAGLGAAAMLIVLLATVTTTFLDVYSAGVSFANINQKVNVKWTAMIVCVVGTLIAMFTPIEQYENFLYLIGSVFAPMIAILITDYFILRKRQVLDPFNLTNGILWCIGFIVYRMCLSIDTVLGSTLPVMILISLLCVAVHYIRGVRR